ncbi:MAG: TPM domain-containing protein [bacterium]|nr:TPM domain-containing protein [bacterium]
MNRWLVAALVLGVAVIAWGPRKPLKEPWGWGGGLELSEEEKEEALPPPTRASELNRHRYPGNIVDPEDRLEYLEHLIASRITHLRDDLGVDLDAAVFSAADTPIAKLADEVFELRRIGEHAPTGGILILINPATSEARIQVSYALEGALPDAFLGRLAADQLDPYISYDAMGMGVMDVVGILERQLFLQAIRGHLDLAPEFRNGGKYEAHVRFFSGGAGAEIELSAVPTDLDFKRRVPEAQRALYSPSADPLESVEALLRSYRDFVGDTTLPLFTPGTQVLNQYYPYAPFEKLERLYAREGSRPFRAIVNGDRAVVTSDHPEFGFIPVLLHRIDRLWRVDDVELWKNVAMGDRGDLHQITKNPYSFGLGQYGEGVKRDLDAWDLTGHGLHELVSRFRERQDALGQFLYADLLVRNAWAFVPAFRSYEQAAAQAPDAPAFWETLGDRADYAGAGRRAARAYAAIDPLAREKRMTANKAMGSGKATEAVARQILAEDPYRLSALTKLSWALENQRRWRESREVDAEIERLRNDPRRPYRPVTLAFSPLEPVLHTASPQRLKDGKLSHDYSEFSVTLTNTSSRPIRMLQVECERMGTGGRSKVGDIVDMWPFENRNRELQPGASTVIRRTWGFEEDTAHDYVAHVFHYCWQGEDEFQAQCAHTRVDQFPL